MSMAGDISTDTPDGERTPIRIADHPRARHSISRAKSWGAVVGFAVSAWFGYRLGNPFVDIVVRSILLGALTSLAVWGCAVAIWKQIIFAELAAARKDALETQRAILSELEDPSKLDEPRRS